MNKISFHCPGNIPDDLNSLLKLARTTANSVLNLVEDQLGPVMQLENFQNGTIYCAATIEGAGTAVAVNAEDSTLLFAFLLVSDFDTGWQINGVDLDYLVSTCKENIERWLEVQE